MTCKEYAEKRTCLSCDNGEDYTRPCRCEKTRNLWRSKYNPQDEKEKGLKCEDCIHNKYAKERNKYPCCDCYIIYTGWRPDEFCIDKHIPFSVEDERWPESWKYRIWAWFHKELFGDSQKGNK